MTAPLEAFLPGVPVLLDIPGPRRGSRGVVTRQVHAPLGDTATVEVCVGPCARSQHSTACVTAASFHPDELLLVPADAATERGQASLPLVLAICLAAALAFGGLVAAGQSLMCDLHDQQLRYCPAYQETAR